jgi:predicted kinase
MLVVVGGLPGTGKTTIAREVALRTGAIFLRIDTIEQALRSSAFMTADVGPLGYEIAWALAAENLRIGRTVIADSVNPIALTRSAWRSVADRTATPILDVEIVCSDLQEHRRRIDSRITDIPGLVLPDWLSVQSRDYEPRSDARMVIDTFSTGVQDAASKIVSCIALITCAATDDQQQDK